MNLIFLIISLASAFRSFKIDVINKIQVPNCVLKVISEEVENVNAFS